MRKLQISSPVFLFFLCLLAGTPAWYLAKYQVVDLQVPPELSIGLRMLLGGLFLECCRRCSSEVIPSLDKRLYVLIGFQGLCMYTLNYLLAYKSALYMPSGLIAVAFSTMIIPNMILGKIFLGKEIPVQSIASGLLGITGVFLCFFNDIEAVSPIDRSLAIGGLLAFGGTFFSVAGTILTGRVMKEGISALFLSSRGMIIGGLISTFASFLSDSSLKLSFVSSPEFWGSMVYLSLVVTTLAAVLYAKLVNEFGAGNASFLWVCTPVSCLLFSALVEGYDWTSITTLGAFLIVIGGIILNEDVVVWVKGLFKELNIWKKA